MKTVMLMAVVMLGCGTLRPSREEACYEACPGSRGEHGLAAACACASHCGALTSEETKWCLEHSVLPMDVDRK